MPHTYKLQQELISILILRLKLTFTELKFV